ncbi:hypothetical protein ACIBCT_12305 [Streptosporangium sp. NPDC050855]|uniref:hypothetical protein n=1 Tax=Streptosporangium sp. NPDC050855 TaxID=3366194 RepID=UPI0037A20D36
MDEISLLGQAVPDVPPPSSQVVARARDRLTAEERRPTGRRSSRRRPGWAWALACAAVTAVVAFAVVIMTGGLTAPSPIAPSPSVPPTSVPLTPSVEPPATYEGLRLLRSKTARSTATKVTLRFRPTSTRTAIVLRCSAPGSFVLVSEPWEHGLSEAPGVCGPDGTRSRFGDKSHEPGWTSRTHTVTFWVFPPDAPIMSPRDAFRCGKAVCDGRYRLDTKTADTLAARIGTRPQPWSVAVYDASR